MFIYGLTVDRGGCFYYRIKQPLKELRNLGHWTSWGGVIDEPTFERANVIVAQMLNFPTTCELWKQWAARGDKLCVWEADDDIFTVHKHAAHGEAYDDPTTVPRMIEMISAAHLVTVTTESLAKVYRKHNPNVVVLPNSVPDWLTERAVPRSQGRGLVMGYTGSPSHSADFEAWSRTFGRWMMRNANRTTLRLYGQDRRPEGMPITWRTDLVGWQKLTEDYLRSLSMDVGIAPLLNSTFNRGKSGIKALEYAALGIPSVCTDIRQYRDTVIDGVTGYLCRTPYDWLTAFDKLWSSQSHRITMGDAALEYARANHTQSQTVHLWEQAYKTAMERIGIKS